MNNISTGYGSPGLLDSIGLGELCCNILSPFSVLLFELSVLLSSRRMEHHVGPRAKTVYEPKLSVSLQVRGT